MLCQKNSLFKYIVEKASGIDVTNVRLRRDLRDDLLVFRGLYRFENCLRMIGPGGQEIG
jgi:hypothetical protein